MEYLFKACMILCAIFFVIECTRLENEARNREREWTEIEDTVNDQWGTKNDD